MSTAADPLAGDPTATADRERISAFCPLYHRAVEIIGRRWNGAIIRALLAGADRYHQITDAVPGLSDRLLSQRLKELEAEGIVVREVADDTPVRVTYRLTDKGESLEPIVRAIGEWADRWYDLGDTDPSAGGDGPTPT